ncbi:POTRA domain-containing protein [Olleya aquimaris]|uniref:Surface antigen-like variable number repeat protein n=1 Tax=Olleya aquimaris TaxID=639310 RepID=A0A327RDY7_9FLAO|nr:POTRA domain-containing protein [Olleya aquimaris]RAJ15099.1 surface antigen-like variable number repeat protein [Olleya aquimaris]
MRFFYFFIVFGITFSSTTSQTITDIKIEGNKKLKTSFIEKISKTETGQSLDSIQLEDDIKLLKRLPSVSFADYKVEYTDEGNYTVIYTIEENFTIIPSVNVYTSNEEDVAYRIGLYEFNLLGQNMTFGGFYQKDIYNSYGINFRAPYLFSREFGLAINHQDWQTQEPVFYDEATVNYRYRNKAFEVLGLYQPDFNNRFELGVNVFKENYSSLEEQTLFNFLSEISANKTMIRGVYEFNNLDFNYQYVSGFKSMLNLQYVTTDNNQLPEFLIGWNDFNYYKRLGQKGNWASRLRVGLATNNDSPFAPFSLDNNLNIRGVGNTIDRGTGAIVLNTEYRHTLIEKGWFVLQGNAFIDAGSWRNPGGDLGDFGDADNLRVFPGAGLRFIHKSIFNAIFRIDYGYGISKKDGRGLVFGIGQYF